jgi:major membrane immunogen (membrane-anchored lipoprotein)
MRKKILCLVLAVLLLVLGLGCQKKAKTLADGTYTVAATLTGGTGKAKIASPVQLQVQDGKITATLVWSSANYDYMKVNGLRYDAVIEDGHSVFTVPVASLEEPLPVVADTVAMSTPHEIEYTITFDAATLAADPA